MQPFSSDVLSPGGFGAAHVCFTAVSEKNHVMTSWQRQKSCVCKSRLLKFTWHGNVEVRRLTEIIGALFCRAELHGLENDVELVTDKLDNGP